MVFDFDGTLVASRFADEAAVAELIGSDPGAAAGAAVFWAHDGEPLLARIELAWPGRTDRDPAPLRAARGAAPVPGDRRARWAGWVARG